MRAAGCFAVLMGFSAGAVEAAYSVLAESYTPADFFSKFDFYTGRDPTRGLVDYVDSDTAHRAGLVSSDGESVIVGVDKNMVAPEGRRSVRIETKKRYTHGLFILDAEHMPTGCGTWPAFWTVGDNWPNDGEIDIIEGVHLNTKNSMALHTSDNCSITGTGHTSQTLTGNCFVDAPDQDKNQGCQIHELRSSTYGSGFNANNGGVYAMEWNSQFIKVWFFPRYAIPGDVHGPNPAPETWGTPAAVFEGGCDIDRKFRSHRIIINTTFCGDWAGGVWGGSGCQRKAATCEEFVANNPGAFEEAYWKIRGMRVFSS